MPNDTSGEDQKEPEQFVLYEVTDEVFSPPDSHKAVDEELLSGPYSTRLENWESAGIIDVREWEYDPEDVPRADAPPELVLGQHSRLEVWFPARDQIEMRKHPVGQFECLRCGTVVENQPTFPGGEIQEPAQCPSCERKGPFDHGPVSDHIGVDGIRDALRTDPDWTPPEGMEKSTFSEVWDEVRAYIWKHWDASGREWLYDGLTAYVLSTWFREKLDFVPHLLIFGRHETGKSRLMNTLKELCYRCVHVADTTPSHIFRSIDETNVTYFLSEYHDLQEDVQRTVDAVIKAGQKRGESIGRVDDVSGEGYVPNTFQPFTHMALSTQFLPRDDIKSRCFQIQTRPSDRDMPRTLDEAGYLRKKLLYLRFTSLRSGEYAQAERKAREYMDDEDLFGRLSEKLWCILTMAELADRDISEFIEEASKRSEDERAGSEEAIYIRTVLDLIFEKFADEEGPSPGADWEGLAIKQTEITKRFNQITGRDVSSQYMGTIRSRLGLDKVRRGDGIYLRDDNLRSTLSRLADENNVEWYPSEESIVESLDEHHLTQDQKVTILRKVIAKVATSDEPADKEDILDEAEEEGVDREDAGHRLEQMLTDGQIYEPEEEAYRLT